MSQETYKLANLPRSCSRSMLNDLQDFMDRLSPPEDSDSSLEIAQLSKNSNLVIQAAESDSPTTDPQTTVSQLIDPLNPRDADCAEAMQLARAMTAKIQRHMRKMAPAGYDVDDILDIDVCSCSLVFKPDGKERARERGAREIEGNFLTLETTKRLINLVYDHLSHSFDLGCRVVTGIILLRLTAVLSNDTARICLLTDFPIRPVRLDNDLDDVFGGVVDYVLARYSTEWEQRSLPENVLKAPRFRKLGSANIFETKSIGELERGLPQCILTTASWCRQSGGEEAMRGAATNGEFWIFFAYKRGIEQSYYARTEVFHARDVSHLDWILGILIDWIENTGICDTFEYFETPTTRLRPTSL